MKKFLIAIMLLVPAPSVWADVSASVRVDQAYSVLWDHDKINATTYNLYINGAFVSAVAATAITPTGVELALTAGQLPVGVYRLELTAVGSGGESDKSEVLILTVQSVTPRPNPPTRPRVVIR